MDTGNDTRKLFPISRFFDCGEINYYYPYGNTPAEDFLENVSPHSVKKPDVLVLGCGDIRSCFYTLWKHFTSRSSCGPSLSPLFSGVRFILNDHSPAVLARNIIFLHLCLQKPIEAPSKDYKKWLCGLWAIWFSQYLLPAHEQMLSSALRDLLSYATNMTSWISHENPLRSLVQFSSEHTLTEIRDIWKMWSTRSIDVKAIDDKKSLHSMVSTSLNSDIENMVGMAMTISLSSEERDRMEYEIQSCSTGKSFAEYVVSDGQYLPQKSLVKNLTMYATSDGKFVMHSLLPFRCFQHGFKFSPSQLQHNCNNEMLLGQLVVADEKFKQYPLLANSVQQFSLWLSCASTILSSTRASHGKQCATFTFHCSDAIAFCNELQTPASKLSVDKKFDVIYTSNLIDPIYPPNLVLFTIPLLRHNSYLLTTTIKYRTLARTTQDYLEKSFGVDNKMLPILFGMRCINHEGNQYKSVVSIRSAPVETNAVCPVFTPYYVKVLVWEKVPPMIISNIPPNSTLWHDLYSSVNTILTLPPDSLNTSSSQTVIKMLQTFLSHVSADDSDGQFWDPLCSLLKHNKDIKHLMHALQTHALLNGLHLHLIVSSETCPVCNGIALPKYFGQFCVSVKPLTQFGFVTIYAQIHKSKERESSYSTFDCLASQNDSNSLILRFLAPLHLSESDYYVSIVSFGENVPPHTILTSGQLKSFLDSAITYSFSTSKTLSRSPSTSLGFICSHYGNGDTFESIIQLSDIGYDAYSNSKKIYPEQLSPTLIKLSCGIHNLELSYPHPIKFDTLSLTISRSRRTVTVRASRACHRYEEEMASVFMVNPDKMITLPQLHLNDIVVRSLMGMQFTDDEQSLLRTYTSHTCPPLPDLKDCINCLMLGKEMYFSFTDPSNSLCVMVMIVNRVFDYQLKAPAIDLIYCATTSKATLQTWAKFSSCFHALESSCNTIQLMDKTFLYFSRRTICSSQTDGLLALQREVDCRFNRAVVYPLFGDVDDNVCSQHKTWNQVKSEDPSCEIVKMIEDLSCTICGKFSVEVIKCRQCLAVRLCGKCQKQHTILCEQKSQTKLQSVNSNSSRSIDTIRVHDKCSYCFQSSHQLRACSRCYSVQYCNQDCQRKDWKHHKIMCHKQTTYTEKPASCSYCNTISDQLKKCTVCRAVQYCDKECQQKHWNHHKLHCKPEQVHGSLTSQTKLSSNKYTNKIDIRQDEIQKCSYCSKITKVLKKCTRCHRAQYCDKICQQKHWNDHKIHCQSKP